MRVTLVQNAPRLSRANLEEVLETVRNGWGECDVIVFPELALNGYWLQDKVFEDAWRIGELSALAEASSNVDIVIGAAIKEEGRTYNSALYFSGGALAHLHHKVHLPNYGMFEEARYFFRGERIGCFESRYGKTALLVCEDLWRASVIAELAEEKPEIVYVLANSPARDFRGEGLLIEEQWDALLRSLALLSSSYVVFVNRVGFEDGLGFWGGSRVITAKGEIEHRLPNFDPCSATVTLNQRLHDLQRWMAKLD